MIVSVIYIISVLIPCRRRREGTVFDGAFKFMEMRGCRGAVGNAGLMVFGDLGGL